MRIYVASSWQNDTKQHATVLALREAGHEVYDFRQPVPGMGAFGWRFRRRGFDALRTADATVLVLPCGSLAHLELGWATGAGQKTIILLDSPMSKSELMYLACSKLCISIAEVIEELEE